MNFCQSCGSKLESADVFCPNCGFKIIRSSQVNNTVNGNVKEPKAVNRVTQKPMFTKEIILKFTLLFGAILAHFGVIVLVFQKWINVEAYRALKETAKTLNIRESLEYQYSLFDVSSLAQTFFAKAQKYDYVDYQDIKTLQLISTVLVAVCVAIVLVNLLAVTMIFIKRQHPIITTILSFTLTTLISVAFYMVVSYVNTYVMALSELDFDRALSATLTPFFIILLSLVAMILKFIAYRKTKTA